MRSAENHRNWNAGWRSNSFFTPNKVKISHALNFCLLSSGLIESTAAQPQRKRTKAQRSSNYQGQLSKTTMSLQVLEQGKKRANSLQLFNKTRRWKLCPCPGIRSKKGKYLPNLSIWPSSYPSHALASFWAIWKCWWEQTSAFSLANWGADWHGLSRLHDGPKRHRRWKMRRVFPWPHSVTCFV